METLHVTSIPAARHVQQTRLIEGAKGTTSIREFGGLWGVGGTLLLDAAVAHQVSFASMVDISPVSEFKKNIAKAREKLPELEIEFINTDFRNPALFDVLKPVDTSLLLNVLLHQENYVSVIGGACRKSRKYVCVTQPCLKEQHFKFPSSASLLQFWPDEIKDAYREGAHWPASEHKPEHFSTASWMWGHTTSHLVDVFKGFGWALEYGAVVDGFLGQHWEYPILRFVPTKHAQAYRSEYNS